MYYTVPKGAHLKYELADFKAPSPSKRGIYNRCKGGGNERRSLGGILQIGPDYWTSLEAMGHHVL